MAKEKKRGFFSWLGFGQKEQSATQAEQADEQLQDSQHPVDDGQLVDKPQEDDAAARSLPEHADLVDVDNGASEMTETLAEPAPVVETAPVEVEPAPVVETAPVEAEPAPVVETALVEVEPAPEVESALVEIEPAPEVETALVEVEPTPVVETALVEIEPTPVVETALVEVEPAPGAVTPEVVVETLSVEETRDLITDSLSIEQTHERDQQDLTPDIIDNPVVLAQEQEKPTKEGFFSRLKRSLVKTKQNLGSGFIGLFRGKKIDDDLFEELEEQLLIADVGVETTRKIISNLTETASRKQLRDAEALYSLLKEEMSQILSKVDKPLVTEGKTPFVILMVGVNGVGKTTTIGKLARQFELEGKSVMLAAGDTFRAAAVEQLQVWGQRNNIPVVAQHTGADSASVIFDAIQAAKSRHIDVLIADTAGRLQNKAHLMEELKKIVRVMKKLDEDAPHEIMLTLDASTGQNAVSQAKLFHEAVGLSGITLTKLDGTAKGGVIFSIADQFGIPIRYIGVGEQLTDLRPFNANDFIEALFARED